MKKEQIEKDCIKIQVPMPELSYRKNIKMKECYLLLHKEYIEYRRYGTFEQCADDDGEFKLTMINELCCYKKEDIGNILLSYDDDEDKNEILISFKAFDLVSIGWFAEDAKKGKETYDLLKKYWLEN